MWLFQEATALKYPQLNDVWGTCDGLNLGLEESSDIKIQRFFYSGWKHTHFISNVFVFAKDGTI